ncbi:MAG: DoxX family protein [Myxococcales bacterium]|nr:DoxX family protein [Myxococcales bacterium]
MSGRTKVYWVLTVLAALALLAGGFANVTLQEPIVESMKKLGYPLYFPRILGAWKLLAAVALLAPGFPRVKEWAYAGITFAMTGATISHIAAGDPVATWFPPLVVLALALGSYALRPADRRLDRVS